MKEFLKNKVLGFGSSDAKLIEGFANTGEISPSLSRRISEIKGVLGRKEIHSRYFELGNIVESDLYKYLCSAYPGKVQSNPTMHYSGEPFKNFSVYNHIDFIIGTRWIELKATIEKPESARSVYRTQLNWHEMIKSSHGIGGDIELWVYDTSSFYENWKELYQFDFDSISFIAHVRDKYSIDKSLAALRGLDAIWHDIPIYEDKEVMDVSDDEVAATEWMMDLHKSLVDLDRAQKSIDSYKASLYESLSSDGIKSIRSPLFNISLTSESSRILLDSKSFKKDHADLFDKYSKQTSVKGGIKISLKNEQYLSEIIRDSEVKPIS